MSATMTLETIFDNLSNGYRQVESGTLQHADQLTAEQVSDKGLRGQSFYAADVALYSLEGLEGEKREGEKKTSTLWLGRHTLSESHNHILSYSYLHLRDGITSARSELDPRTQLERAGYYRPYPEDAKKLMAAKSTQRIDLTKLRLQSFGSSNEYQSLEISTTDYQQLNEEERKLAERLYGQGEAFVQAMEALNEGGVRNMLITVLSPSYVEREAQQEPMELAVWRSNFYDGAIPRTSVGFRNVNSRSGLRGVRRAETHPHTKLQRDIELLDFRLRLALGRRMVESTLVRLDF